MNLIMLSLAFVTVIGYAKSLPVSDELMTSIRETVGYWGKLELPAGVGKMLSTAHQHFPSMIDMWKLPKDSKELDLLAKELDELGIDDGCREVIQYALDKEQHVKPVDPKGVGIHQRLELMASEAKNKPAALGAIEASLLCLFLEKHERHSTIPVTDDIKKAINSIVDYSGKYTISPGLEKMLKTVRKHFPKISDMDKVHMDDERYLAALNDLAKLGKQEGCEELIKYDNKMVYDDVDLDDISDRQWLDLLNAALSEDPVAEATMDALTLCNLVEYNPMYLALLNNRYEV